MKPLGPLFKRALGPIKWCRTCGRKHQARAECGLVQVERIAKSGRKVMRWAQPEPEESSHKKSKARKS